MPYSFTHPLPLAVFISGNGSNLQAIIDAIARKEVPAEIKVVISNREDAYGLERAKKAGIATEIVMRRDYENRAQFDQALLERIQRYQPELIVLAGFMHILSPEFVQHFPKRILNIHPSLLPKYPGLNTHQRAIEAGDKLHGVSVHIVTAELDAGPILAQAQLVIHPDDTPESLQARVHALEHQLYPQVIGDYAAGKFLE